MAQLTNSGDSNTATAIIAVFALIILVLIAICCIYAMNRIYNKKLHGETEEHQTG